LLKHILGKKHWHLTDPQTTRRRLETEGLEASWT